MPELCGIIVEKKLRKQWYQTYRFIVHFTKRLSSSNMIVNTIYERMFGMANRKLLTEAEKIIDQHSAVFLKNFVGQAKAGAFKKYKREIPDFPVLQPTDSTFFEQKYFMKLLDSYIRDYLANPVLVDLLSLVGLRAHHRERKALYSRFSNEAIEDAIDFEFTFEYKSILVGCRYTSFADTNTKLISMLLRNKVSHIFVIDWADSQMCKLATAANSPNKIRENNITHISLKDFFSRFLSGDLYQIFITKARNAVAEAHRSIGIQSIKPLYLPHLAELKADILGDLCSKNYTKLTYRAENHETTPIPPDDFEELDRNFKSKALYRALTGEEDFAKSFITAEYLYDTFTHGISIDYTSVICGYLKSIEQLLWKLTKMTAHYRESNNLWIKTNKSEKELLNLNVPSSDLRMIGPEGKQVLSIRAFPEYIDYYDSTFGSLTYFLTSIENRWLISKDGKLVTKQYLTFYRNDYRNELFHKENIYDATDTGIVSRIRTNTLIILYLLLGGYSLTGNQDDDYAELGIVNTQYNRLYFAVTDISPSVRKFYLSFSDGKEIKAVRCQNQEIPTYNADGEIISSILFAQVDDFDCGDEFKDFWDKLPENKRILISRNNMPTKVSWQTRGEKEDISW